LYLRAVCRIQFCDTAECNSALRATGYGRWMAKQNAGFRPRFVVKSSAIEQISVTRRP
jgi:hypothetical protein